MVALDFILEGIYIFEVLKSEKDFAVLLVFRGFGVDELRDVFRKPLELCQDGTAPRDKNEEALPASIIR